MTSQDSPGTLSVSVTMTSQDSPGTLSVSVTMTSQDSSWDTQWLVLL